MNDEVLIRRVEKELENLRVEFGEIPPERVTALGEAYFDRLRAGARITEFIPVLVRRQTRDELLTISRHGLHTAA
jgi:hypothetical protein